MLKSDVADLANAANSPMAGCITAALFLKRFVPDEIAWAHLDTYAWRDQAKPGRPKGGDALGLRAVFAMLAALLFARLTRRFAEKSGFLRSRRLQHFALLTGLTGQLRGTRRRRAAMSEVSLTGWMKALIAYVRSGEPDLTNRQMALLMLVYLTPGPHTVRGLARVLGVSKPVVTRALNTLGALGYLRRERDQDDRRNVFVVRTSNGADFLEGFKRNLREGDDAAPPPTGRSSARPPPTPTSADDFALTGPSDPPDPLFNAYRKDLADVALAGRVIASHYAEPVERTIIAETLAARRAVGRRGGGPRAAAGRAVPDARRQPRLGVGLCRAGPARRLCPQRGRSAASEAPRFAARRAGRCCSRSAPSAPPGSHSRAAARFGRRAGNSSQAGKRAQDQRADRALLRTKHDDRGSHMLGTLRDTLTVRAHHQRRCPRRSPPRTGAGRRGTCAPGRSRGCSHLPPLRGGAHTIWRHWHCARQASSANTCPPVPSATK